MASARATATTSETAEDTVAAKDIAAARRVLCLANDALASLSDSLDGDFTRALDAIMGIKGRVVVSGMGKSGHVARKIAATLASTGTPSHFLHPAEASHGDLGMVTPTDALLMLSNSGETAELSDLITHAKRLTVPLIGMASKAESALMQAADIRLLLPKAQEACPMGMAPTTSTTMMMALGDALAVALMERRGFDADQYRVLHPAGALGRSLIRVSDLMHTGDAMPAISETASMEDAVNAIMKYRLGCVGVVDSQGALIGIITDGDLSRHMDRTLLDRAPASLMSRNPKTVRGEQLAAEALAFMNEKKITQLFILDQARKPVGILHVHDCLKAGLS